MKEWLAGLLKPFADLMLALVMAVPMDAVRIIFIGLLIVMALWVLTLRDQYPEGGIRRYRDDLRFFAVGVLVLQALLYIIF